MKKMLSLFSAIMIRPTIYRAVTKCAVALTVVLLWDRYVNKGLLPVGRDGCFAAALLLFGLAWLNYLRLDGLEVPHLLTGKNRPEKKKKRRRLTGDIADFADEHIVPFDELSEEEQLACSMAANLASGVIFLIPAVIIALMG